MEIEMKLVSKEMIKPSKPTPHNLKSYMLSLSDQFMPERYIPVILFYPSNNTVDCEVEKTIYQLKQSLSETLTLYYPLAGRMKNMVSVDCTDEGVLFIEAQVDCNLSHFISQTDICISKMFFPFDPRCNEYDYAPLVSLQVTVFECGGLAISSLMFHKVVDAASMSTFLNTWARYNTGKAVPTPDLSSSSTLFPAIQDSSIWRVMEHIMEEKVAPKHQYCKRRFVFDSEAIAAVRDIGKSVDLPNPTSIEALTAFMCNKFIKIKKSMRSDFGMSLIVHAVNLRTRMEPPMPQNTFGNFLWVATSFTEEPDPSVAELVVTINNMICAFTADAVKGLQGDEGVAAITNLLKDTEDLFKSVKVYVFKFSSWRNMGLYEIDFGHGTPIWIGQNGEYISYLMDLPNFVVFQSYGCGGIEAWVTLEEDEMEMLENDSEFLEFAAKNPVVHSH